MRKKPSGPRGQLPLPGEAVRLDVFNILLGNGGGAVDEWARQALERKPSITLDPLKPPGTLTIIKQPLAL